MTANSFQTSKDLFLLQKSICLQPIWQISQEIKTQWERRTLMSSKGPIDTAKLRTNCSPKRGWAIPSCLYLWLVVCRTQKEGCPRNRCKRVDMFVDMNRAATNKSCQLDVIPIWLIETFIAEKKRTWLQLLCLLLIALCNSQISNLYWKLPPWHHF